MSRDTACMSGLLSVGYRVPRLMLDVLVLVWSVYSEGSR